MNITRFSVALFLLIFVGPIHVFSDQLVDLKCDFRVEPLAVDRSDLMLSGRLDGDQAGLAQTAYQIQAASSPEKLDPPDHWDSGWIDDSRSMAIEYAGKIPAPMQRVHWRVRIQDESGKLSPWSTTSWFVVGLLNDRDWRGADSSEQHALDLGRFSPPGKVFLDLQRWRSSDH